MATPRFSILIPTRDRPETLRHTLQTVISQPGEDYEVIVADNCCGPQTRQIVEELGSPKLVYTRSDEVLPMADNWERGLALCSGEYITVLGDDDGFVPSTLAAARKLVDATQAELFSWSPHVYWWPDTIVRWSRNFLIVQLGNEAVELDSRSVLQQFYADTIGFGMIPMIYCAFFHRGLIEEAQRRFDGFFVPRDVAPDVASGILGLHITERYVHSTRPLSVRGNSAKSNGSAWFVRSLGAEQREVYFKVERIGLKGMIHNSLVPSPNLDIIVASTKLKCREAYFPDDSGLTVDLHLLLRGMIARLNVEPEVYEDNLRDAMALAAKLGVAVDPSEIPAKEPKDRTPTWGPDINKGKGISYLGVNGDLAGLRHVGDAARLAEALLDPVAEFHPLPSR